MLQLREKALSWLSPSLWVDQSSLAHRMTKRERSIRDISAVTDFTLPDDPLSRMKFPEF